MSDLDEPIDAPPQDGPGLFGEAPAAAPPAAPYRVLARKYRPNTFAELIGQDALVRTLRHAFQRDRVAHAYMLTGVRGVGKTTTARIIARALNCVGPDGTGGPTVEPCGVCPECVAILADRHPDVQELDAASNNGVDDVREIREAVRYRPARARCKVWILDEVHMLSGPAFNALLKTLEEPPPAVRFVFATTELRKVPATILSRCQTFHLRRVPQAMLRDHFAGIASREGVALEPEALATIARAADGSVRDGLSLLDQAIAQGGDSVTADGVRAMLGLADGALVFDVLEAALRGDLPACLNACDRAHELGADPAVLVADLLTLTHTLTRLVAVPTLRDDPSLPEAERVRGAALAERLSVPLLGRAWGVLLKGAAEVQAAPDRRAAVEMVLIRLAHLADLPTPGELVRRLTQDGSAPPHAGAPAGSRSAGQAGPASPPANTVAAVAVGRAGGRATAQAAEPVGLAVGSAAVALAAPETHSAPIAPRLDSWPAIVALASGSRPRLHAHLLHSVHPVRIAEGRIELRVLPDAPRDLAAHLAALLLEVTGARWTIALSNAPGEATLAEQGRAAEGVRLRAAAAHPLVQAILAAFPGAEIAAVTDGGADAYGLVPAGPTDDLTDGAGDDPQIEAEDEDA